jgi:hypothetical protein
MNGTGIVAPYCKIPTRDGGFFLMKKNSPTRVEIKRFTVEMFWIPASYGINGRGA